MSQSNRVSSILNLVLKDLQSLYNAYMPFIGGGGLFYPTKDNFFLGDEVFIRLTLMDDDEPIPVSGEVVWVTPSGSQSGQKSGIGIKILDKDNSLSHRIETYLQDMSNNAESYTM